MYQQLPLIPEMRAMIEAHLFRAFLDAHEDTFAWMDWLFLPDGDDIHVDAAGGVWEYGVTSKQGLRIARYRGRYIEKDGEDHFKKPRGINLVMIEQNPHKNPEGKKSTGQELTEWGFRVTQIKANDTYLGMLVAKGEHGQPNSECYLKLYRDKHQ